MALFFTQLLNGIQNGAVYASLAVALVLIFRTTGILNFAQGEIALFSTYIVWKLTTTGMPVWLAILITDCHLVRHRRTDRAHHHPTGRAVGAARDRDRDDRHVPRDQLATQLQFGSGQHALPSFYPATHVATGWRVDLLEHDRARRCARGGVRGAVPRAPTAQSSGSRSAASRAIRSRADCSACPSGGS